MELFFQFINLSFLNFPFLKLLLQQLKPPLPPDFLQLKFLLHPALPLLLLEVHLSGSDSSDGQSVFPLHMPVIGDFLSLGLELGENVTVTHCDLELLAILDVLVSRLQDIPYPSSKNLQI